MFSLSQIFHGWRLRACHSSLPGMTIWKMINSWDEDAKTSEIICEWFDILGWLAQLRTKTFSIKLYLRSYIYICWIGQTPEATSVHAGTIRYNDPSMKELDWRFSFASCGEGWFSQWRHSKAQQGHTLESSFVGTCIFALCRYVAYLGARLALHHGGGALHCWPCALLLFSKGTTGALNILNEDILQ